MAKIVRVYLSTFIDVEVVPENYASEQEMVDDVEHNLSDYIELQQLYDNLALEPLETEVLDCE